MDNTEKEVFRRLHNYTSNLMNNEIICNEKNEELRKLNLIYKELIIRNTVMNVTSPKLLKYFLKNKI
jgi:hypothetical protein